MSEFEGIPPLAAWVRRLFFLLLLKKTPRLFLYTFPGYLLVLPEQGFLADN